MVKPYEISSLEQLNEERNHCMDIWSYYGGVDGGGVKQHYGVYGSIVDFIWTEDSFDIDLY